MTISDLFLVAWIMASMLLTFFVTRKRIEENVSFEPEEWRSNQDWPRHDDHGAADRRQPYSVGNSDDARHEDFADGDNFARLTTADIVKKFTGWDVAGLSFKEIVDLYIDASDELHNELFQITNDARKADILDQLNKHGDVFAMIHNYTPRSWCGKRFRAVMVDRVVYEDAVVAVMETRRMSR